jgi:hypothetical protein
MTSTRSAIKPGKSRVWYAVGLVFLAPLIAEFLLGNLPIKLLPALIVLAPMYGGGALLIRECARRARRGWPSIVLLAVAYGLIEEAFTTQSLFNPNYLHLNVHLLDPAYIPRLGIGAWWTVFVITLHAAWSISTSIALIESLAPSEADRPWLSQKGLIVTGIVFVLGAFANTYIGYRQDHFIASDNQLFASGILCFCMILVASKLPDRREIASRNVPQPVLVAVMGLIAGSAVLLIPRRLGWVAAGGILGIDLLVLLSVLYWSRSPKWRMPHKLALASGAASAYAWHAFIEKPAVGGGGVSTRVGNVIFAAGALGLIEFGRRRVVTMELRSVPAMRRS